jgi:hypothetical protein
MQLLLLLQMVMSFYLHYYIYVKFNEPPGQETIVTSNHMVAFLFLWVGAMTAIVLPISAFIIPSFSPPQRRASLSSPFSPSNARRNSLLSAGKGFGDKPTSPTSTKKPSTPPSSSSTIVSPTLASPSINNEDNSSTNKDSAGSELLRTLRSREAERRDTELRKLRDLRDADALVAQDAGAAVIPEKVAQRMGTRMIPFVGIPLFGSAVSFIGFWYLATYKDMEFQPAIVATTSFVFLFIGLLVCIND